MNMGGPDSLEAVGPFLYNLFSDRMIVRLGPEPLQRPLARLISAMRAPKARKMYELIGGKSPLNDLSWAQAAALEEALGQDCPSGAGQAEDGFRVYVGMNYWHPFVSESLAQASAEGIKRLIAMPLYPHYSLATTGSSLRGLKRELAKYSFECQVIPHWYRQPDYISALVLKIKEGMARFGHGEDVFVLFSAHGLPVKFLEMGDVYVEHIRGTISAVRGFLEMDYALSFQSRTGPVKWIEPYTDEMLKELARQGARNVLIVPISFISDHVETLYEIDILYKKLAKNLNIRLERTESLNTEPLLIKAMEDIICMKRKELGW